MNSEQIFSINIFRGLCVIVETENHRRLNLTLHFFMKWLAFCYCCTVLFRCADVILSRAFWLAVSVRTLLCGDSMTLLCGDMIGVWPLNPPTWNQICKFKVNFQFQVSHLLTESETRKAYKMMCTAKTRISLCQGSHTKYEIKFHDFSMIIPWSIVRFP